MQKSALPKVSGRSSRSLARSTAKGTSPDALRPCGLHATSCVGTACSAEQKGRLRSFVSHQCGNPSGSRARSPASRCRNRLLQRPANKEISCELNISERTVKFHVSSLLSKFKVRSRKELMREASKQAMKPLPAAVGSPATMIRAGAVFVGTSFDEAQDCG